MSTLTTQEKLTIIAEMNRLLHRLVKTGTIDDASWAYRRISEGLDDVKNAALEEAKKRA